MANELLKVAGFGPADISKIGGVAISDINKIAGVSYQGGPVTAVPLQYFENFPGHNGAAFVGASSGFSNGTLSFQAVNIPANLSFNNVAIFLSNTFAHSSRTMNQTFQFGLYSFDGTSLDLVNSASRNFTKATGATGASWISFVTSTTSVIPPGTWYFAFNILTGGVSQASVFSYFANSSVGVVNAEPIMLRGRMSVSTNAMPAAVATSDLNITGATAVRQPYIIITA
jgi:hypothetical protein